MRTLLAGLAFPEGPRWHEDRLWFSDMHAHEVVAVDQRGVRETICKVPNRPSGLGWLPDGRLLVVSMLDRRILRLEADGQLAEHANLWDFAAWHCNDAVVDRSGRMYVGNFGFDLYDPAAQPRPTTLTAVEPDGSTRTVADDLQFPNGTVITPDGSTLVVGESGAGLLTAFDISATGDLVNRRVWAALPEGCVPDGICLDAAGAIWSACPRTGRILRIAEGGELLDERRLTRDSQKAYACMLGGTTLYVCAATSSRPETCIAMRGGTIETFEVEVPGAGWP